MHIPFNLIMMSSNNVLAQVEVVGATDGAGATDDAADAADGAGAADDAADDQHKQQLQAKLEDVEEKMTVVGKLFAELQQQHVDIQKQLGITPATSPRKRKRSTTKPSAANFDGKIDATVQAARIWNTHISNLVANGGDIPNLNSKTVVDEVKVGSLLQNMRQNVHRKRLVAMLRLAYINEHMKNSPAAIFVNIPVNTRKQTTKNKLAPTVPHNKRVKLDDDFTKFLQEQVQTLSVQVQEMEMAMATEKVLQGEAKLVLLNQ